MKLIFYEAKINNKPEDEKGGVLRENSGDISTVLVIFYLPITLNDYQKV